MAKKYSKEWWQSLPPEKAGKETEKLVESLFTEWNKWQSFAWHRLPDARTTSSCISKPRTTSLCMRGE